MSVSREMMLDITRSARFNGAPEPSPTPLRSRLPGGKHMKLTPTRLAALKQVSEDRVRKIWPSTNKGAAFFALDGDRTTQTPFQWLFANQLITHVEMVHRGWTFGLTQEGQKVLDENS